MSKRRPISRNTRPHKKSHFSQPNFPLYEEDQQIVYKENKIMYVEVTLRIEADCYNRGLDMLQYEYITSFILVFERGRGREERSEYLNLCLVDMSLIKEHLSFI